MSDNSKTPNPVNNHHNTSPKAPESENFSFDNGLSELFEEILAQNSILQVRVTGQSMFPYIRNNDIVFIEQITQSQLRLGDLIFYKNRYGALILHRLLRKNIHEGKSFFQTKGDAKPAMDVPAQFSCLLGRVVKIERKKGDKLTTYNMTSTMWNVYNKIIAIFHIFSILARKIINALRKTSFF